MKRALHLVALFLACGFALFNRGPLAVAQETQRANPDPQRFAAEIRAFEDWDRKNSTPPDAVLFVGSSSIRLWPTAQSFPNLAVINRGFGGSHAADVNHFSDRIVLKYRPRTIVFYAGDNDIADGKSPEQIRDDYQAFIRLVHNRSPTTRIVFLSIKPSVARWRLWPRMQQANALIRQLVDLNDHVEFLDVSPPLLGDDGRPRAALLLDDGLHLNEDGYREWTKIVAPVLSPVAAAR